MTDGHDAIPGTSGRAQTSDAETGHRNPWCLACGESNPASTAFTIEAVGDGTLTATAAFGRWHEGAPGRTHGGAIATVLDEALGVLAFATFGEDCLTATLNITYESSAVSGEQYTAHAHIERREGRKLWLVGEVAGDRVVARAEALFVRARRDDGPAPP